MIDAGKFIEYQSISTLSQKSKLAGEDHANVVLIGQFVNSTLVFTHTMDSNLGPVGILEKIMQQFIHDLINDISYVNR